MVQSWWKSKMTADDVLTDSKIRIFFDIFENVTCVFLPKPVPHPFCNRPKFGIKMLPTFPWINLNKAFLHYFSIRESWNIEKTPHWPPMAILASWKLGSGLPCFQRSFKKPIWYSESLVNSARKIYHLILSA